MLLCAAILFCDVAISLAMVGTDPFSPSIKLVYHARISKSGAGMKHLGNCIFITLLQFQFKHDSLFMFSII